ncbi:MAG TPA: OmpA family protein [Sumerlaeia bacterium]|nr:OmpA family protein [Sumerlaeia bacterium]
MKKHPFLLARVLAALCLFALLVAATGCAGRLWYAPWKKKSPPPIYPETLLVNPPDSIPPPVSLDTSQLPGAATGISIPADKRPASPGQTALEANLLTVHFAYDSYEITPEMRQRLEHNSEWIRKHPGIMIQVEGHCDERGSYEYNMNLGQERADTVREELYRLGVEPGIITTVSWGEERPLPDALGHDEDSWAKNRRAQFLIY